MKKLVYFVSILMLVVFVTSLFAANTRDGRRKFRKNCYQMCHKKDGIIPSSYTSAKWDSYFTNNMEKLKKVHKNNELEKSKLSVEELNNIHQYLLEHSLDSRAPETCEG
ncbi:cytochrome c family protein [Calditerrivibrio nitroreducens]|uniref:Cytochrome c family protein n=1 Tax=Calditerrivibrio nitroreducens (strain DSM 19672 / NBRC 101217 / Yu37-1) TaxID=768670 RepID=E4TEU9_CALNY|nr:cytochrome c family protein [Calditerrivibrio nitroreducens]ADR18355.1 cytochrome c family protein [Calditerrivibrio nitroreducens DSM 19672]